jgi:hypothetical protein
MGGGTMSERRHRKAEHTEEWERLLPLFDLAQALGEEGWLKALKLGEYAPRKPRRPGALQQVLFAYTKAI